MNGQFPQHTTLKNIESEVERMPVARKKQQDLAQAPTQLALERPHTRCITPECALSPMDYTNWTVRRSNCVITQLL